MEVCALFASFNPSTLEAETGKSLEFEDSLVYRVSCRIDKAVQRNPVSKTKANKHESNVNETSLELTEICLSCTTNIAETGLELLILRPPASPQILD